ncbi:MAG: tyrosine-type recombinase/integrase [Gemmatimonadota bacterium]|jgi:integrase
MPRRKRKNWSKSFGPYGSRIRIFEDPNSGILYAETRDPTLASGYRSRSLRHRDRARAERWATQQLAKLQRHERILLDRVPVLRLVAGLYLRYQSPKKCATEQKADARRAELWTRYLGADRDLSRITRHEWDSFIELRAAGAIDARGRQIEEGSRRPVRNGSVKADLVFLRTMIHWAMKWQDRSGRYLMREDPTRGFDVPRNLNPRRPVATLDRYERVLAVADQIEMEVSWAETRVSQRSYLREVLVLAHHTGRRISAILALRYEDLRLDRKPHAAIRWPADTDKMNRESLVPVSPEVLAALESILRERPGIGAAPIFPAPKDPSRPVSTMVASTWLLTAEKLAGVEKHYGSLWHAYRRGWATARKHLPDVDVAAAGGWADTVTLKAVYQQADESTMYRVVSQPMEIREA